MVDTGDSVTPRCFAQRGGFSFRVEIGRQNTIKNEVSHLAMGTTLMAATVVAVACGMFGSSGVS